MSNAMAATSTLTKGPSNTALIPVPQGCDVAIPFNAITGIGKQENTNTAAPKVPTKGKYTGICLFFRLTWYIPIPTKGIATANHVIIHFGGKIPSVICMAYTAFSDEINNRKKIIANTVAALDIYCLSQKQKNPYPQNGRYGFYIFICRGGFENCP